MKAIRSAIGFAKSTITYWKKPKDGEYVSNKEIVLFATGIMGTIIVDAIGLGWGVGCFLIGAIYKITFRDLYIIGFINMITSLIYGPISMIIVDNLGRVPKSTMKKLNAYLLPSAVAGGLFMLLPNHFLAGFLPAFAKILGWNFLFGAVNAYYTKSVLKYFSPRFGKFRSFIVTGWLPCLIAAALIVYLPFRDMYYPNRLWILNCLFGVFNMTKSFSAQRGSLQNVITPNTNERVKINTLLTTMMAPVYGLMGVIVPILATFTGGMTNYNTYRVYTMVFFLVGIPLTLMMGFGVKDRIILEEKHETNINMFEGIKQVLKNKYLWILYISDNIQAINWGTVNLVNILIIYMLRQDWLMGIVNLLTGFFGFPGLFLAPFFAKRIGKRNMVMMARLLHYSYFLFAFLAIKFSNAYLLYIGLILSNLFNTTGSIARDTMTSDMWDYQQYISGKRLESSMGILNTLGSPIVTLMAMTVPFVYGLFGFTNDWNILYMPDILARVLNATLLLSLISHTLGIIPYLFYDLSEKKHAGIMAELEARKRQLDEGPLRGGEEGESV